MMDRVQNRISQDQASTVNINSITNDAKERERGYEDSD